MLNYEPDLSFDTVETIVNYEYIEAHGEDDETLDAEFIQQLLLDDNVKIQLLSRIKPEQNFSKLKLMLPIRSKNSILRPQ